MEDFYPAEFYNDEEYFGDAAELDYEDDGQPSEYEEWQDYMGGDDWDYGQTECDY